MSRFAGSWAAYVVLNGAVCENVLGWMARIASLYCRPDKGNRFRQIGSGGDSAEAFEIVLALAAFPASGPSRCGSVLSHVSGEVSMLVTMTKLECSLRRDRGGLRAVT